MVACSWLILHEGSILHAPGASTDLLVGMGEASLQCHPGEFGGKDECDDAIADPVFDVEFGDIVSQRPFIIICGDD